MQVKQALHSGLFQDALKGTDKNPFGASSQVKNTFQALGWAINFPQKGNVRTGTVKDHTNKLKSILINSNFISL